MRIPDRLPNRRIIVDREDDRVSVSHDIL